MSKRPDAVIGPLDRESESAVAVLALWALEAVSSGRPTREAADAAFVDLFLDITDGPGPDISEEMRDLLLEGMTFDDWGDEWGPDPERVRRLAFAILRRPHAVSSTGC